MYYNSDFYINLLINICKIDNLSSFKSVIENRKYINVIGIMNMVTKYGSINILKYIIEYMNIPPNINNGMAILNACKYGHFKMVDYLIKVGVDPTEESINIAYVNKHYVIFSYLVTTRNVLNYYYSDENAVSMLISLKN